MPDCGLSARSIVPVIGARKYRFLQSYTEPGGAPQPLKQAKIRITTAPAPGIHEIVRLESRMACSGSLAAGPVPGILDPMASTRTSPKARHRDYRWADYDDEELLDLRFSSLGLTFRGSPLRDEVEQLHGELERRGIGFKPHVWLSTEWFSPDRVPGFAVPFYLAHPRLRQLERTMMGEVEGGNRKWRHRIMRHEAGHAIDVAYGLRRRASFRRVFGPASAPYPDDYSPEPASHDHVLHLGHWYAQSHPTEDFAETFAVWLQPKASWRRHYADWPALEKLEYIDALMADIATKKPKINSRKVVDPLREVDQTLGEHYLEKQQRYGGVERRYDRWMARVFVRREKRPRATRASRFVREIEPQLRRLLVRRARLHPYYIDHAITLVKHRSRQLDLVLRTSRRDAKRPVVRLHERIVLDILKRNRENYAL